MAQWIEHRIPVPRVGGSSPFRCTKKWVIHLDDPLFAPEGTREPVTNVTRAVERYHPYWRGTIQPHGFYSLRSTERHIGCSLRFRGSVHFLNQHIPKTGTFVPQKIVNCQLSIVNWSTVPCCSQDGGPATKLNRKMNFLTSLYGGNNCPPGV